jgi:phenol/toluene 2-monooxygenase (NADH) P2/A2
MTETPAARVRNVGVDMQDNDETRTLIEAIERDNPDAVVRRMPGMVKVMVPREMVIQRTTVEEILGREWDTQEFQLSIISLVGNISEWDEDEIRIKWEH